MQEQNQNDTQEFEQKIILVTAWAPNSVVNNLINNDEALTEEMMQLWDKPEELTSLIISQYNHLIKYIDNDGIIGKHLDFKNNTYTNTFIDRPHSHWSWNSLCHANKGGTWENSPIVALEPLNKFDNVYGVAPYDTMVLGPHKLSNESVILVPNNYKIQLENRINSGNEFIGTIVGYDPQQQTIRKVVAEQIQTKYHGFELQNKNNENIANIEITDKETSITQYDYDFIYGNFNNLFINNNNLNNISAYKQYINNRHTGLHLNSATDIESNQHFNKLKTLSTKPENIDSTNKDDANIFNAVKEQCEQLYKLNVNTGTHNFAEYLIKKMIIVDLRSNAKAGNPPRTLPDDELKKKTEHIYTRLLLNNSTTLRPNLTHDDYKDIVTNVYTQSMQNFIQQNPDNQLKLQQELKQTLHQYQQQQQQQQDPDQQQHVGGSNN